MKIKLKQHNKISALLRLADHVGVGQNGSPEVLEPVSLEAMLAAMAGTAPNVEKPNKEEI